MSINNFSPITHEFVTAPLNPPRTGAHASSSDYWNVPRDLYTSADWELVQAVAMTAGGGSYPSTSADQGGTYGVSTSVLGLFARKRPVPWSLVGKCYICGVQAEWSLPGNQERCTNCVGMTYTNDDTKTGKDTPEAKGWERIAP